MSWCSRYPSRFCLSSDHPALSNTSETLHFCVAHPLTSVRRQITVQWVKIRNFVHKGLKKLCLEDSSKGLPADAVDKLRAMLTYLQDMQDTEKLLAFPLWKAHQLTGDRKGVWSLHVTRN